MYRPTFNEKALKKKKEKKKMFSSIVVLLLLLEYVSKESNTCFFSLSLSLRLTWSSAHQSILFTPSGWLAWCDSSQSRRDLCMDGFVRCELSSSGQEFILSRVEKGGVGKLKDWLHPRTRWCCGVTYV